MSFKLGDMSSAVKMFFDNYEYKTVSETYVKGEKTKIVSSSLPINCAVLPLGAKELRNLPEGEYTSEDKTVITDGASPLKISDLVLAFNSTYEVKRITDVSDIVNLKVFVAKKKNGN